MNKAQRVSKLAARFAKLQEELRAEGLGDVADEMRSAASTLIQRGLDEYKKGYDDGGAR